MCIITVQVEVMEVKVEHEGSEPLEPAPDDTPVEGGDNDPPPVEAKPTTDTPPQVDDESSDPPGTAVVTSDAPNTPSLPSQ